MPSYLYYTTQLLPDRQLCLPVDRMTFVNPKSDVGHRFRDPI